MTLGGTGDTLQRRGELCFISLFRGIQELCVLTLNLSMEFISKSFHLTTPNLSPHRTINNTCNENCTFQ